LKLKKGDTLVAGVKIAPLEDAMFARCLMPVFLFALLLTQGCQQQVREATHSYEADINVLRDVEIAEEQAWSSKDVDKTLSFYADDATLMYPNMPAIVGKDSIRAYMKLSLADPALTIQYQITRVDVAQSGDLGYTQGTSTYTMTDPKTGKPMNDRSKWLTVRKKQADGSWKIVQDTFSSDLPLPNSSK
jgi:uncharacterized protein (TIGR02246 family)